VNTLKYPRYKNFVAFLENKSDLTLENIDPFYFFNDLDPDYEKNIKTNSFQGRQVILPTFSPGSEFNKHSHFEDYTKVDELRHIALWVLSCFDKLSNTQEHRDFRSGKEFEIELLNNPRNGRLDVVQLINNFITVVETKTTLESLLQDRRYITQNDSYSKQCKADVANYNNRNNVNYEVETLLVMGGEETDIFPAGHPDCTTGSVGRKSDLFYKEIIDNNVKFISANAIWLFTQYKLNFNTEYNWNDLIKKLYSGNYVGLLTGGFIKADRSIEKFAL